MGSYTLEATLIFPLLFLIVSGMLLLGVQVFLQDCRYAAASAIAERAAFVWPNSQADPLTGGSDGRYDGLYWRIFQDASTQLDLGGPSTSTALPANLQQVKLSAAAATVSGKGHLGLTYRNAVIYRSVTADLQPRVRPQPLPGPIQPTAVLSQEASSTSYIAEPAEFIRNLNALRQLTPAIRNWAARRPFTEQVKQFSPSSGSVPSQPADSTALAFNSHDEARAYLQRLVSGRLARINTTTVGSWRLIDALDAFGVAHQCYFGYKTLNSMEIRPQYEKDAELLKRGKLSGVVWHFFRRKSDGSVGLSPGLRAELERRGITVVIHDEN